METSHSQNLINLHLQEPRCTRQQPQQQHTYTDCLHLPWIESILLAICIAGAVSWRAIIVARYTASAFHTFWGIHTMM